MAQNIFESIKHINEYNSEYWSSRELAKALEYANYSKFLNVISKAKISCKNSGEVVHNHFAQVDDMVKK